jgi:hypothetical protein
LLAEAVALFAYGTVELGPLGAQSAEGFRAAMRDVAGLPTALTDRWCALLSDAVAALAPPGAAVRRTLVMLPANTFTCLEAVCEAVLGGEEVWIRPSRREPVSALRFAAALLQSGWPGLALTFYPCGTDALAALLAATDRHIVFGGEEISTLLSDPRGPRHRELDLRGAGRGCALVPADADPHAAAAWLTPLIAADGGRFCKNVRTVLCAGDPGPVADALAGRLDAISLLTVDPRYPQASVAPALAQGYARFTVQHTRPGDQRVTTRELPHWRDERATLLAPTLLRLADPGPPTAPHPLLACELPFPFASICAADDVLSQAVASRSRFVYRMADSAAPGGEPA